MNKQIIVVICGPTATGKTTLGVQIAKKRNGEIISADSRQIYRGLDTGTAKISKKDMQGIPHYMIDVANPRKQFSVAEFQKKAHAVIKDVLKRKKLPIIVGGTGFYIDALLYDQNLPPVEPNAKLRKKLGKLPTEKLKSLLKKLDTRRYREIDKNNRVRLMRAIEIAKKLGHVPINKNHTPLYNTEIIYLDLPDKKLKKKIHKRNVQRVNKLIKEVKNLHRNGLSWKRLYELGLEYRYTANFIQEIITTKQKLIEMLDQKTWQYAKRQRTWFKKYIKIPSIKRDYFA